MTVEAADATAQAVDHASIASGMKCIPLPSRKRGAQSAEGVREVKANALVVCPEAGRELYRQAILKYVSQSAAQKYRRRLSIQQRKVRAAVHRLLGGAR